eukprot:13467208-Alexandrium_andersonii.AAC.1
MKNWDSAPPSGSHFSIPMAGRSAPSWGLRPPGPPREAPPAPPQACLDVTNGFSVQSDAEHRGRGGA